jgi:hypothetical protein
MCLNAGIAAKEPLHKKLVLGIDRGNAQLVNGQREGL